MYIFDDLERRGSGDFLRVGALFMNILFEINFIETENTS